MTNQTMFDVRGISLSTFSRGGYADGQVSDYIDAARESGANQVVLGGISIVDLATARIGDVVENGFNQTARMADVADAARAAHAAGLAVTFKPQLATRDPAYQQYSAASWINLVNPDLDIGDPAAFFGAYKAHILEWARLAQALGVEALSIGNEMVAATRAEYTPYWADIIAAVRSVYDGELTYAALAPVLASSSTNEIAQVGFWHLLDFAGFDVYPHLAQGANPSVAALNAGWHDMAVFGERQDYYAFLCDMAAEVGIPVVFTETGCASFAGANDRIATTDATIASGVRPSDAEQVNWWHSFFATWGADKPAWLKGAYLFNNDPADLGADYAARNYNFFDKPAEQAVAAYYGGRTVIDASSGRLSGSAAGDRLFLYDPANSAGARSQSATLDTEVTVKLTGALIGDWTPSVRVSVNGADLGTVALKPIDSLYRNAEGTAFTTTQAYSVRLPGLTSIHELKLAWQNDTGDARASTFFHSVAVNGVALEEATYHAASGGSVAQAFATGGGSGNVGQWDGGYTLVDASAWNRALAGRTIGSAADPIAVDGGDGADTLHLLGTRADYRAAGQADGRVRLSEDSGLGQNAILSGIETLRFADGDTVALADLVRAAPEPPRTLTGTKRGDTLAGGAGADRIDGGAGNDQIDGGGGNDVLVGGKGGDRLIGGAGDDRLSGGRHDDLLTGGAGADTFLWLDGRDRVTDYEIGIDRLLLNPGTVIASTQVRDYDSDGRADLRIAFKSGGEMLLSGITSLADVTIERAASTIFDDGWF